MDDYSGIYQSSNPASKAVKWLQLFSKQHDKLEKISFPDLLLTPAASRIALKYPSPSSIPQQKSLGFQLLRKKHLL